MNRNIFTGIILFAIAGILITYTYTARSAAENFVVPTTLTLPVVNSERFTLFKSAGCGCCSGYVQYLQENGINADVRETTVDSIKAAYGIPQNLQSCHTSVIGKYFVEGHVPIEAIRKLLQEQPDITGITLPGMPSGTAGMHGEKKEPFRVYALAKDGTTSLFMDV